jgi:hypothetical protein
MEPLLNPKKSTKNQSLLNIERQGEKLARLFGEYKNNVENIVSETHLGTMNRLADKAYGVIQEKGNFTSHDCAELGILEPSKKNRLFSVLVIRHEDVGIKIANLLGNKRKIKIAEIKGKENKFAGNPDEKVLQFIYENRPTRAQLKEEFSWSEVESNSFIAKLVRDHLIEYSETDGRYTTWN